MVRFLVGAVAGGLVLWWWGEDLRKFAASKTRSARLKTAETLRAVQETADSVLDAARQQVDSTLEAGQHAVRPGRAGTREA